jgi:hypothetical protein
MKLLDYFETLKEKIMARPKGSKNKSTVEQEEVVYQPPAVPFNYEDDDSKFDSNYQVAPQGYRADPASFVNQQILQENVTVTDPENHRMVGSQRQSRLFLVEGEVQLASRTPGSGAMVAKQLRLVEAISDEQAINKYVNYFRGLSDAQSVYTVINAAAMETIN